jgi:SAM-dependent methyltransferase
MARNTDPRLAMAAVRARYNEPGRYGTIDAWHRFTAEEIKRELSAIWTSLSFGSDQIVLNAGAGGTELGLAGATTLNLDISETRVSTLPKGVVASIESLPLADQSIDAIICVGSVINYCDAAAAISEFGRVLKRFGHLVLEFESSRSAELIPQHAFGKSAAVADTFYAGEEEAIWVYTFEYITNLLCAADISIVKEIPIHVLSPWALLLFRSSRLASLLAPLDKIARRLHPMTRWASNQFLLCTKGAIER